MGGENHLFSSASESINNDHRGSSAVFGGPLGEVNRSDGYLERCVGSQNQGIFSNEGEQFESDGGQHEQEDAALYSIKCESGDGAIHAAEQQNNGTRLDPLSELSEYRRLHQERYEQRIVQERKIQSEQQRVSVEQADEELAREMQQKEQQLLETRLASDAEYSRQLYQQLNDNPDSGSAPLLDSADNDDSVRAPMRTGYTERLIDESPFFSRRNPSNRRLLNDEVTRYESSWHPLRWLQDCLSDERDRQSGWYMGPFLCTNRILAVYVVVITSLFAVLVILIA